MTNPAYRLYYQRNLPHYQPPGATLFITFRLAGSLPREIILKFDEEKQSRERELANFTNEQFHKQAREIAQKKLFALWDAELDRAQSGPTWLAGPDIANLICESMHYRDGREFTLEAYCVMPNHVHLVCTPLHSGDDPLPLSVVMQSLKGYTARKANQMLGRQGAFWQHESYDHVVRDSEELARIVNYVLENPRRAGLPDQWVYCRHY